MEYTNHPVADLFPMLADDELAELAADITERGLLQPIVLDSEGRVLDGRNRLQACHMAGIEPRFETYDGDDPDGYALAVNIARRHLTKGQIAMVAARAAAVSSLTQRQVADAQKLSKGRIGQAATVLRHAPDLADSVVSGAARLDQAYATAKERKQAAQSVESRMADLQVKAPDLAALVKEERVSLSDATASLRERQAEEQRIIEQARRASSGLVRDFEAGIATISLGLEQGQRDLVDDDTIARLRKALEALETKINEVRS